MTTLPIVEDFDVIEDGVGQFEPRLALLSIEQLVLHARPERLHHRVVERVTFRPERGHETRITDPFSEGPGSEWTRSQNRVTVTTTTTALRSQLQLCRFVSGRRESGDKNRTKRFSCQA